MKNKDAWVTDLCTPEVRPALPITLRPSLLYLQVLRMRQGPNGLGTELGEVDTGALQSFLE